MSEQTIRDSRGMILGTIKTEANGDQTARALGGKILGYYRASRDVTTDVGGRIIARGNCVSALIYNNR